MIDFRFDSLTWLAKRLPFLKKIPLLAILLDEQIKCVMFFVKPRVFKKMMQLTKEVKGWEGISTSYHRYGGLQFNFNGKEIGHLHGNGLLDILLNRKFKEQIELNEEIQNHLIVPNSSWLSFKIRNNSNIEDAVTLLKLACTKMILVESHSKYCSADYK